MPTVSYCGRSLFYQEAGEGPVLLFLHGNTASSRLFKPLLPLYAPHFRCVLLDFLGNGRSDRTESFPTDLWQDQARQALALIRAAGYERPCLLGTSGGAWAAMNAALLAPDAVGAVVADSFDGRTLHPGFARELTEERARAKRDPVARGFYEWCQGPDWEAVVDRDTDALLRCAASGRPLFCRPLEEMGPPVLLLGSREDPMCRRDLAEEYAAMAARLPCAAVELLPAGGHPAVLSQAEAAAAAVRAFLGEHPLPENPGNGSHLGGVSPDGKDDLLTH